MERMHRGLATCGERPRHVCNKALGVGYCASDQGRPARSGYTGYASSCRLGESSSNCLASREEGIHGGVGPMDVVPGQPAA
jgi:hypothetical protein